jgi:hypothetical protein
MINCVITLLYIVSVSGLGPINIITDRISWLKLHQKTVYKQRSLENFQIRLKII